MSQAVMNGVVNGVDVGRMGTTIQALQQNTSLAAFRFRADNRWIDGGHNQSTIRSFYGAGEEDTVRTKPFLLDADEPPILLGKDQGANPVEYVLHALAACLTTSLVYHAAAQGIRIESVESKLEGDLDLRGFLGISGQIRKGYESIRVHITVKSDASAEQLKKLTTFSPVYDIVSNPVPVSIQIDKQ
ncbi:MAG TPA: OsmC family protein [Nitrospiraceae bacterium]|nr:OsmC family protein [Nitrospiraceae bacterium]